MYADRVFFHSVLSKWYQVESDNSPDPDSKKPRNTKDLVQSERSVRCVLEESKLPFEDKINNSPGSAVNLKNEENFIFKTGAQSTSTYKKSGDVFDALREKLKNRKRFTYSYLDFIYTHFCWIKRRFSLCKKKDSVYDNYIWYQKGVAKYEQEIDLVSIITSIRRLNLLMDMTLDQNQRLLEIYSPYHNVEFSQNEYEMYMKDIPKYKGSKHISKKTYAYNSCVNGFIDRYRQKEISNKDIKLMNIVMPNYFEKDKMEDYSMQQPLSLSINNMSMVSEDKNLRNPIGSLMDIRRTQEIHYSFDRVQLALSEEEKSEMPDRVDSDHGFSVPTGVPVIQMRQLWADRSKSLLP